MPRFPIGNRVHLAASEEYTDRSFEPGTCASVRASETLGNGAVWYLVRFDSDSKDRLVRETKLGPGCPREDTVAGGGGLGGA